MVTGVPLLSFPTRILTSGAGRGLAGEAVSVCRRPGNPDPRHSRGRRRRRGHAAEEVAKRTEGVRGVANDIGVRLNGEHTDPEIARDAVRPPCRSHHSPQRHSGHRPQRIRDAPRRRRSLPAEVPGGAGGGRRGRTQGIANQIVIRPVVLNPALDSRVAAALRAQGVEHASVDAEKGVVTLHGHVRSTAEKRAAESAVWATSGVCFVQNLIVVER